METYFNGKKQKEAWIQGKKVREIWKGGKKIFDASLDFNLRMSLISNLLDTSGKANTITTNGSVTFNDGAVFNGSSSVNVTSYQNVTVGTGSITYGCEFNLTTFAGTQGIVGQSVANGYALYGGRYSFFIESGEFKALFQNAKVSGVISVISFPISQLTVDTWHKVVVVIDRTNGVMKLFINNTIKNSIVIPISSNDLSITSPFYIGAYGDTTGASPSYFANGKIRKAFVIKKALTDAEATTIFNQI